MRSSRRRIKLSSAKRVGQRLGVDWREVDIHKLRQRMEEARERRECTLEVAGKIALKRLQKREKA